MEVVASIAPWVAVLAGGASVVAIITFWMNRGKAEARIEIAVAAAATVAARIELISAQLAETRFEFARDYATHKDLSASEGRYADALNGLRMELRGMNGRLDNIIERLIK